MTQVEITIKRAGHEIEVEITSDAPHIAFVNTAVPGFAVDDKISLDWPEILAANAKLREKVTLDDEPDDFTPRMSKRETEHAERIYFLQPHKL